VNEQEVRELKEQAAAAGLSLPAYLDLNADRSGLVHFSTYLTAEDSTRIAVDVWRPPTEPGVMLPASIRSTRYWRDAQGNPVPEHRLGVEIRLWTEAGFAFVLVDARGTGASGGTWPNTISDGERSDLHMVVDWVLAQPWSDGTVGGSGTSYEGSTTLLLASTGHPAVKAVVPRFAPYDAYHHIGFPGGVPNDGFLGAWAAFNWTLDGHPERADAEQLLPVAGIPRPVPGHEAELDALRAEHADNWDLAAAFRSAVSREDVTDAFGELSETTGAHGRIKQLRAARVPTWLWSAWYDGAYAVAALAQLMDPELDVRVTIGPWAHGGIWSVLGDPLQPGAPIAPTYDEQQRMLTAYLQHHQTGAVDDPSPARLRYFTLGDGWHDADTWPPAGTTMERNWLGADGGLAVGPEAGATTYDVDFSATTGRSNRWWLSVPVEYGDRRDEDRKLVVWDGDPLPQDTEITGNPVASLRVSSTASDGAFHVYLETVAPDGTVTYLNEGNLRGVHRKLGQGRPPYATFGPWHSYSADDLAPLPVGEEVELVITLWPMSARVPAGHRLRVCVAGADDGIFRRIPDEGAVQLSIAATSWIDLPVRHG
jgi:putative CocE/NonD family hydrolase